MPGCQTTAVGFGVCLVCVRKHAFQYPGIPCHSARAKRAANQNPRELLYFPRPAQSLVCFIFTRMAARLTPIHLCGKTGTESKGEREGVLMSSACRIQTTNVPLPSRSCRSARAKRAANHSTRKLNLSQDQHTDWFDWYSRVTAGRLFPPIRILWQNMRGCVYGGGDELSCLGVYIGTHPGIIHTTVD